MQDSSKRALYKAATSTKQGSRRFLNADHGYGWFKRHGFVPDFWLQTYLEASRTGNRIVQLRRFPILPKKLQVDREIHERSTMFDSI